MEMLKKIKELFGGSERNPALGRNEPCWCGSGRKYKRCHLDRDRERSQGRAARCGTA